MRRGASDVIKASNAASSDERIVKAGPALHSGILCALVLFGAHDACILSANSPRLGRAISTSGSPQDAILRINRATDPLSARIRG